MLDNIYLNNLMYHYYICTMLEEDRKQRLASYGKSGIFHVPELAFVHRFMQNICNPLYNVIGEWPQIDREASYGTVNLIDLTISVGNYFFCFEFKMDDRLHSVVNDGIKLIPAINNGAICYLAYIKAESSKDLPNISREKTNYLKENLKSSNVIPLPVADNFFYISAPYDRQHDQWAAVANMWQLNFSKQ